MANLIIKIILVLMVSIIVNLVLLTVPFDNGFNLKTDQIIQNNQLNLNYEIDSSVRFEFQKKHATIKEISFELNNRINEFKAQNSITNQNIKNLANVLGLNKPIKTHGKPIGYIFEMPGYNGFYSIELTVFGDAFGNINNQKIEININKV